MQLNLESAQTRLANMNMGDMPVVEFRPSPSRVDSDWFSRYKKLCHEFMESLTDSVNELAFMNLTQDEFMALIMGRALPRNTSIRFRIPLIWGGKLETENLFMCWTFPQSNNLDIFIAEQHDAPTVWLPNPAKKVYIPSHNASGGDGGNATDDRLSQMAAQIKHSHNME